MEDAKVFYLIQLEVFAAYFQNGLIYVYSVDVALIAYLFDEGFHDTSGGQAEY